MAAETASSVAEFISASFIADLSIPVLLVTPVVANGRDNLPALLGIVMPPVAKSDARRVICVSDETGLLDTKELTLLVHNFSCWRKFSFSPLFSVGVTVVFRCLRFYHHSLQAPERHFDIDAYDSTLFGTWNLHV